jgi:uncharacterized protein (TIGR01777 family)
MLCEKLTAMGHHVVVLSRSPRADDPNSIQWDGKTIGQWANSLDGSDVVINLAGRTVNCRYNATNRKQMMDSRVDSTRVVGQAIAQCENPPQVWLQMSTATIYDHRLDAGNDEESGWIGADKTDYPESWKLSVEIAKAWEREQEVADTPATRKVALRTAMVMSPIKGSIFGVLSNLVRLRLGGSIASGNQYVSWIHEADFVAAIFHLINDETFTGPVNLASPNPLPQKDFMSHMRNAMNVSVGLPATKWMATIGAVVMQTETELILKSRRVVPGRLLASGFEFQFPEWNAAVKELTSRMG